MKVISLNSVKETIESVAEDVESIKEVIIFVRNTDGTDEIYNSRIADRMNTVGALEKAKYTLLER